MIKNYTLFFWVSEFSDLYRRSDSVQVLVRFYPGSGERQ